VENAMSTGASRACETVSAAAPEEWEDVQAFEAPPECRSAIRTQAREAAWLEWEFVHLAAVSLHALDAPERGQG